jgi:transposase
MAAKAIAMEPVKQILRLHQDGFSIKAIVRLTGISRPTVKKYLRRIQQGGQENLAPTASNERSLSAIVYDADTAPVSSPRHEVLLEHFSYAEKELTKPGVTKQLLWLEYKDQHPDGYGYSQYCYHFSQWLRHKEVVMHLEHKAAATIMIDFAGKTLRYTDLASGEVVECQVFIAVLPHSGLIFCVAVHTQRTADLAECLNAMLRYYGGVTLIILCDNLKTAVIRPDKYEPLFTDMCYQLSEHYGTTFAATRPAKPRDKAMVERCVNIVYNHIYGPLRNQIFHSLKDLNTGIATCLEKLNNKRYKGSSYSRRQLFDNQERALLRPLPSAPFTLKRSIQATVQRNYHIQLSEDHRYYSVPYGYVGKKVKVLYDSKTLEIYYDHSRIALHHRSPLTSAYVTIPDHMPSNHRYALQVGGFTQGDLLARARQVGPQTALAVEHMLSGSIYPEQNYKACHGLLMLQKTYGPVRLENACVRALTGSRINYTLIKNILRAGLDSQLSLPTVTPLPEHDNIRGAAAYQ